jgi:hypothetical protein
MTSQYARGSSHGGQSRELVICSDRITHVSLAQGQALQKETDKSQKKRLDHYVQKQK